jgi:hypothetical protein
MRIKVDSPPFSKAVNIADLSLAKNSGGGDLTLSVRNDSDVNAGDHVDQDP